MRDQRALPGATEIDKLGKPCPPPKHLSFERAQRKQSKTAFQTPNGLDLPRVWAGRKTDRREK